jgi:transcriptional/translational regulatory protein YebC/TACO1
MFNKKGRLLLAKDSDVDAQILKIIDLGVDEVEESGESVEVLVSAQNLGQIRDRLIEAGFLVQTAELTYKPQALMELSPEQEQKLTEWLDALEELDDVQAVYTNW